jgi:hypothetical protein
MANQVAYGFMNLRDLFDSRVTEVGASVVTDAIATTVAEHERQIGALTALFCERTTEFKRRYQTVNAARLQPMDEAGRARPIKPSGQFDVSWPLDMAGIAWGADFITRAKMTVGEANRATQTLIMADARWMRDHILAALYNNVDRTFVDPAHGSLTVKPLANGDTDTYQVLGGADLGATDTHQFAQAGAIADGTNPFPTIYSELTEHPENGGDVVALVPTANVAACKALTTFHAAADRNLQPGSGATVLVGNLGVATPGTVFGYTDAGVWLVEWRSLPDNYLIGLTTQGPRALAMREDPEPELRGFRPTEDRVDYPWWERQYMRRAGFGAWNRVGAVAYRVGNGTYAIPTGYTSPMA